MRYPASETAEKHARILTEASRLFRARGFAGVSLSEIMKASGLTHGPFYNHFESKEALMAASIEHASELALADLAQAGKDPKEIRSYVQGYLSAEHRDSRDHGCLMAALATDVARDESNGNLRSALTKHFRATIDGLQRSFPWRTKKTARHEAINMISSMVGAIVLARAVDDSALSEEILKEVRETFA